MATLCMSLFLTLMVVPGVVYWLFDIPTSDTADFMSRRAAILFLGLAIVISLSRNEANTNLRRSVSLGAAVLMGSLAILGGVEFFRGAAGAGIWLAILTETFFSAAYFYHWSNRSADA